MVESAPFIRFFISRARHLLTDFADLVFSKSLVGSLQYLVGRLFGTHILCLAVTVLEPGWHKRKHVILGTEKPVNVAPASTRRAPTSQFPPSQLSQDLQELDHFQTTHLVCLCKAQRHVPRK